MKKGRKGGKLRELTCTHCLDVLLHIAYTKFFKRTADA